MSTHARLLAGAPVRVSKLDYCTGKPLITWSGVLVEAPDRELVVRATFSPPSGREPVVDGVRFARGDIFTEYYFLDRWYNVFHLQSPSGQAKGWYCNVTTPATFDGDAICYIDLALDLFVHPDGRFTVLDQDEFAVACDVYLPEDAARAREALEELIALATEGRLPAPVDDR